MFFELVDGSQHAIFLKLVELVPDESVFETGFRPNDAFLIDFLDEVPENVEQGDEVEKVRGFVRGKEVEALKHRILGIADGSWIIPDRLEPVEQLLRGLRVFRHSVHREAAGAHNAKASGGEVRCSGDGHRFASGRLNVKNILSPLQLGIKTGIQHLTMTYFNKVLYHTKSVTPHLS